MFGIAGFAFIPFAALNGNSTQNSASETITLTDSEYISVSTFVGNVIDTTTLTDPNTVIGYMNIISNESVSMLDGNLGNYSVSSSALDLIYVTDTETGNGNWQIAVSDTQPITDNTNVLASFVVVSSEPTTLTDTYTSLFMFYSNSSELFTVTDPNTANASLKIASSEYVTLSDIDVVYAQFSSVIA